MSMSSTDRWLHEADAGLNSGGDDARSMWPGSRNSAAGPQPNQSPLKTILV